MLTLSEVSKIDLLALSFGFPLGLLGKGVNSFLLVPLVSLLLARVLPLFQGRVIPWPVT